MTELVECRSDSEYAERPVAIRWQGQRLEVVEILGRWRTPNGKRFLVRTVQQGLFEISFSITENQWHIYQT
jgi:hypothetical protein